MKRLSLTCLLAGILLIPAYSQKPDPFSGRWDLTVTPKAPNSKPYPDWMEVAPKDGAPALRIQPRSGSAFYAKEFKIDGNRLHIEWPNTNAKGPATTWDLELKNGALSGTQKRGDTVFADLAGVHAPALNHKAPKAWTAAEPIFNGKDLTGWEPTDPAAANHWIVKDGELINETKGANLKTTRKFDDFKLHIEYNCPQGGNSGVYLRGRYEVQVEYEPADKNDKYHGMGAIYGFIAPSAVVPPKPGQWESYDVTLVGRKVTVVRDGVTVVDNQNIPGITGGALDSHESEPGPLYLQGDHTGGLKYRNITISLPQ
jgi:hypothetical protein